MDLLQGLFSLCVCVCQVRDQTKRCILDQVHVHMVFYSDLPRILRQKKGLNYKRVLLSSAGPSGHSSKACWLELSALLASYSKRTHGQYTSGQAHIVSYINTSTQRVLSCMLMHGLSGEVSILTLIVFFYALAQGSLWPHTGRGWMRIHARSSDRGLLVDRWEGGGPLQPGQCSSISCGVAMDCSYYIIQVDHCQSLLQPF